jgi:non-heme chloroperoxidase
VKDLDMRKVLRGFAGLVVLILGVLGGALAFSTPARPPPLASISDPFARVDFSDLPPLREYAARDGSKLGYRAYPGGAGQVVVLIHGSSGDSGGMHPLAKALRDAGAGVYVPDLRGHAGSGRSGDVDYIGQLEDDLADLVAALRPLHPEASFSLIGFSSGGGFTLRVIAGKDEKLFDRFVLISPALPRGAPTLRPDTGGWVSVAVPRVVALAVLNRVGVDGLNGLPIVAFATSPHVKGLTGVYSFRMAVDFGAPRDYLAGLARSEKPAALLVGGADELFYPDRFAPLFAPARPDLRVTIVPGVGHVGMTVTPEGIAAVRRVFEELVKPSAG